MTTIRPWNPDLPWPQYSASLTGHYFTSSSLCFLIHTMGMVNTIRGYQALYGSALRAFAQGSEGMLQQVEGLSLRAAEKSSVHVLFIIPSCCKRFQFQTLKLSRCKARVFRVIGTDKSFTQSGNCQQFFMAQGVGVVKASKNFLKEKEIN